MWRVNEGAFFGIQSAHNGYLEVFLNVGIVGCGLLTILLMAGYRNIIKAFRRDPDTYNLSLAFFIVALVYNFSEAGFRMVTPIWFVLVLAVMMSTMDRGRMSARKGTTRLGVDERHKGFAHPVERGRVMHH
jgi:O-antigen ligase